MINLHLIRKIIKIEINIYYLFIVGLQQIQVIYKNDLFG